jgi:glyoxylase-like metal-dependent hydrolase (beta-lactamase superfamily II)
MTASLPVATPELEFPTRQPPRHGEALEIVNGIRWLRMPLPFALDHVNLWLLKDGDGWTQVDCGYGDATTRDLWESHCSSMLQAGGSRRVIATHCHPDHVGNGAWLTRRFDCALTIPQAEYLTAHALLNEHSGYGVAATCALFRAHGMEAEHLAAHAARGNTYRRGVPDLPDTYERLSASDELVIGGSRWRVIPGFGHSPEHASLYCADGGVLISGDMLLPKISTNVSVWSVEPDADPLGRFLDSLDRFAALPPRTLVLPSHGPPFVGIHARIEQLRAHHAARLEEIEEAAASGPLTAASVVPLLFRRPLDVQQRFFAMGEAIAHLNHLWHHGRLLRLRAQGTWRFVRP